MKRTGRKQEWSLTMFAFGTVVFFPPIIALFNKPVLVFGLPLAYLVMFCVWAVLIFGIWLGARPPRLWGALVTPGPEERREQTYEPVQTSGQTELMMPSEVGQMVQPQSPDKKD